MYPLPVGLALVEMLAERPNRKARDKARLGRHSVATATARKDRPHRTRRHSLAFWRIEIPTRLFN